MISFRDILFFFAANFVSEPETRIIYCIGRSKKFLNDVLQFTVTGLNTYIAVTLVYVVCIFYASQVRIFYLSIMPSLLHTHNNNNKKIYIYMLVRDKIVEKKKVVRVNVQGLLYVFILFNTKNFHKTFQFLHLRTAARHIQIFNYCKLKKRNQRAQMSKVEMNSNTLKYNLRRFLITVYC